MSWPGRAAGPGRRHEALPGTLVAPELAAMAWPQVAEAAGSLLLAVPVGATEQHGPHLPLGTDTTVAEALAGSLARARAGVVVGPALPYGASGEHAGFPGTLSIGQEALELVVVELVRSAGAFAGVVVISGHGGNARPLGRAAVTLAGEGRPFLAWWPTLPPGRGDAHAGRTETSVLLALDAGSVDQEQAVAGDLRPLSMLAGQLRAGGVAALSPNGVLGDPAGASAEEGETVLAGWAASLVSAVAGRWPPAR